MTSLSSCCFTCIVHPRYLLSFPTRRSSDLLENLSRHGGIRVQSHRGEGGRLDSFRLASAEHDLESIARAVIDSRRRSEEHTSELQSRFDLVCRLLLEKKNQKFYYAATCPLL